jgi:hypothetical protein
MNVRKAIAVVFSIGSLLSKETPRYVTLLERGCPVRLVVVRRQGLKDCWRNRLPGVSLH